MPLRAPRELTSGGSSLVPAAGFAVTSGDWTPNAFVFTFSMLSIVKTRPIKSEAAAFPGVPSMSSMTNTPGSAARQHRATLATIHIAHQPAFIGFLPFDGGF
jgi:hypothetical protein